MYGALKCSIAILILTIIARICLPKLTKKYLDFRIKGIYISVSGVIIAIFVIMCSLDSNPSDYGSATTIPLSAFHTLQVMLAGYNFADLKITLTEAEKNSWTIYTYIAMLFIAGPVCTFGFVLSFFETATSYIRLLISRKSDLYVISDISEKSIALGNSIRKKFPKANIVYTNVFTDDDAKNYDFINEAKDFKAIFFKFDISKMKLIFRSKNTKVTFFVIGENESKNVDRALSLIEAYNKRENTELYVFSTSTEGGLLLDSAIYGDMKVRRINEDQNLAYSVIYNKKDTNGITFNSITKNATQINDKKAISALIIGMGGYGTEITKALLWCCQLPGYELKINIIDKNENCESLFAARCPEIIRQANGASIYSIHFYKGVDAKTKEFNDIILSLKDSTLVFVSLGNDELNIDTAIQTRILFKRMKKSPEINAIVHSPTKSNTLKSRGLKNFSGDDFEIKTIGCIEDDLSYDSIVNADLEKEALRVHFKYSLMSFCDISNRIQKNSELICTIFNVTKEELANKDVFKGSKQEALKNEIESFIKAKLKLIIKFFCDNFTSFVSIKSEDLQALLNPSLHEAEKLFSADTCTLINEISKDIIKSTLAAKDSFNEIEYNRNSSAAEAIHSVYPKDTSIEAIEITEHRRWNAYMRTEGYIYSGSVSKASRDNLAKMHNNLTVQENLNEDDIAKDTAVTSKEFDI